MKKQITVEIWEEIIAKYRDGASLNTCVSLYKINHQIISAKLKSLGIFRDKTHLSSTRVIDRRKFMPRGKFEHVK